MERGGAVEVAAGVAEVDERERVVGFADAAAEGVVEDVVGDGGFVLAVVVDRHVADRAEVVVEQPIRFAVRDAFVGEDLIDGRPPQKALLHVA